MGLRDDPLKKVEEGPLPEMQLIYFGCIYLQKLPELGRKASGEGGQGGIERQYWHCAEKKTYFWEVTPNWIKIICLTMILENPGAHSQKPNRQ